MKNRAILHAALTFMVAMPIHAQQINDNNTPLHLMKPAYRVNYGIPSTEEVKATMDRVLNYIDEQTPAVLVDRKTGKEVTNMADID